ncbi:DUF4846 domain-containing protein [Polyangium aurulentum]|uniref:DUF4846 domain-containing protein n=1 Tax=Polyangium aurulentum TaxID=2567896 RepID=UPI0010AE2CE6|nr:DUF4846 domain-containing protein [Polyangium aurulentum]UQA56202.1 DUF4846 domain-containing protein [Polyangium aurulentum]
MRWTLVGAWVVSALVGVSTIACRSHAERPAEVTPEPRTDVGAAVPPQKAQPVVPPKSSPAEPARDRFAQYAWLADAKAGEPAPVDTLEARIPPKKGYTRLPVAPGSFGAFLRGLPLAAPGTPVVSYAGDVIREADHPNVAAVAALDVGRQDLQQCADSILRLHAEWRFSSGGRDQAYRAASGLSLSFPRYVQGERLRVSEGKPTLVLGARPSEPTHALLRTWLDDVFGWTNTGALVRDARKVELSDLRAGDFFVVAGSPYGHAVLVLDVAKDAQGRRALLLGQGFVPAQSFHVLRPSGEDEAWFALDEEAGAIKTPFWAPFPFSALRRIDGEGQGS